MGRKELLYTHVQNLLRGEKKKKHREAKHLHEIIIIIIIKL